MRGDRALFDRVMFACHLASTLQQLLYHGGLITVGHAFAFEVMLFALKWCFECWLGVVTADLLVHHVGMLMGALVIRLSFPAHSYVCVHLQSIHIPLAMNYGRRLGGSIRGGRMDRWFGYMWLLVASARCVMMASESARMLQAGESGRWWMSAFALTLVALDVLWSQQTFEKREWTSVCGISLASGVPLGLISDGRAVLASSVWGSACAIALLTAGPSGLPALLVQRSGCTDLHEQEWTSTD